MASSIKMENVDYCYNDNNNILHGISIDIKEGEIFGLLGPSGAGKTTIVKLLTGQLEAGESKIEVFGKPIGTMDKNFYSNIGMVMDQFGLYERLTCFENLKIMSRIHNVSMVQIQEVLTKVGLKDAMNKEVSKLSTGMKQRLMISRAILHSPRILFLDEPTRGLDPKTAGDIHDLLLSLKKEGVTIFLTTHNMVEAEKLCDNIALLYEGSIVEYGTIEKIKSKYYVEKNVKIIDEHGKEYIYRQQQDKEKIIALLNSSSNYIMHTMEPTLEEIFIRLTGKELNNEEE